MIRYPLLYLLLYCKIRRKHKGIIRINKSDFRAIMAKPIGIDGMKSEFLLRDFKRYGMIKNIQHGKRSYIILTPLSDNAHLFKDLTEMRRVGLI